MANTRANMFLVNNMAILYNSILFLTGISITDSFTIQIIYMRDLYFLLTSLKLTIIVKVINNNNIKIILNSC